jgi:hypothetical protein
MVTVRRCLGELSSDSRRCHPPRLVVDLDDGGQWSGRVWHQGSRWTAPPRRWRWKLGEQPGGSEPVHELGRGSAADVQAGGSLGPGYAGVVVREAEQS